MQATYKNFVDRMIKQYEGNYGWDRADPGGPTKYGITCYDLAAHRHQEMNSMATWAPIVKAMSLAEAEDIYATKYAAGIMFNDLGAGKDVVMFDYAVNSGVSRPIRVARALLLLPGTPVMTRPLADAINRADTKWFINAMCDERLHFMKGIRQGSAWARYSKGWGARVLDLRTYAMHLWTGAAEPPAPDLSNVPTPKATNVHPEAPVGTASKGAGAAVATGVAAAAGFPAWAVILVFVVVLAATAAFAMWRHSMAQAADETVVLPPRTA